MDHPVTGLLCPSPTGVRQRMLRTAGSGRPLQAFSIHIMIDRLLENATGFFCRRCRRSSYRGRVYAVLNWLLRPPASRDADRKRRSPFSQAFGLPSRKVPEVSFISSPVSRQDSDLRPGRVVTSSALVAARSAACRAPGCVDAVDLLGTVCRLTLACSGGGPSAAAGFVGRHVGRR